MQTLGDLRTHFWKTVAMGKTCGVDLQAAIREGILTEADYADAITRCRGCPEPESCRKWLLEHDRADAPPEFCTNRALWTELMAD